MSPRLGTLDQDQIVVLPLDAGCGKVRGAGAQQRPVDLIALEVRRRGGCVLGQHLDARHLDEIIKDLRGLAFGKLGSIEIDANLDAAIGGACERLHNRPVV